MSKSKNLGPILGHDFLLPPTCAVSTWDVGSCKGPCLSTLQVWAWPQKLSALWLLARWTAQLSKHLFYDQELFFVTSLRGIDFDLSPPEDKCQTPGQQRAPPFTLQESKYSRINLLSLVSHLNYLAEMLAYHILICFISELTSHRLLPFSRLKIPTFGIVSN